MPSNKETDKFDFNIDELLSQLAELTDSSFDSHQAHLFLLLLWAYFEISIVEEDEGTHGGEGDAYIKYPNEPNIIQVEKGYQVFDYGSHLKTSAGKYYGSYSTGRLLTTVKAMINLLIARGAKKIQFGGLAVAQRFAWLECEANKVKVTNFTPDNKAQRLSDRLSRLDSLRNSVAYTATK
jgi:hypothetical protein